LASTEELLSDYIISLLRQTTAEKLTSTEDLGVMDKINNDHNNCYKLLYRLIDVSWHLKLRTGGFGAKFYCPYAIAGDM